MYYDITVTSSRTCSPESCESDFCADHVTLRSSARFHGDGSSGLWSSYMDKGGGFAVEDGRKRQSGKNFWVREFRFLYLDVVYYKV